MKGFIKAAAIIAATSLSLLIPAQANAAPTTPQVPASIAQANTAAGFTVTALYCSGYVATPGNNGWNDLVMSCIQKGTSNGIAALRPYTHFLVHANNSGGAYCLYNQFSRNGTLLGTNQDDTHCLPIVAGAGADFPDDIYGDVGGLQTYQLQSWETSPTFSGNTAFATIQS